VATRRLILTGVFLCIIACGEASQADVTPEADYSSGTHVVLLGTGTPNADPERSGPAVAVIVDGTPYLVDAGPGIVRRAAAAWLQGVEPLRVANLAHLFLTHLHSDHTLGLPDVMFSPWVLEREEPLEIYGPHGTARMVEHLQAAYEQDVRTRIDGLEPANTEGYKVHVREIEPGLVYEDEKVSITAFPVRHGSWEVAFGYRFESRDRVIVISGDAVPSETLALNCDGCDVLVHEVYSQAGFERRDSAWQRYHAASHTSTVQLAELARRARPGLLVLYHQLFWGTSDEDLLAEITSRYDGRVVSGRDLDVF
jgi:ribonuclease BN (tRNA processing enzyme)